jgi:hypothetical protein
VALANPADDVFRHAHGNSDFVLALSCFAPTANLGDKCVIALPFIAETNKVDDQLMDALLRDTETLTDYFVG